MHCLVFHPSRWFTFPRLLSWQLKTKQKKEEEFHEDRQKLQELHDRLLEQQEGLAPLEKRVALARGRVAGLRKRELAELQDFVAEATVSPEAQAALEAAEAELKAARRAVSEIPEEEAENIRLTEEPSRELQEAVEAICVLLEIKPDFFAAQSRLMKTSTSLSRRLLVHDPKTVPKAAAQRLRSFVEGSTEPTPPDDSVAPAPTPSEQVAAALRRWVLATMRYDAASSAVSSSDEDVHCSINIEVACSCVCELYGLSGDPEDQRVALQLAAAFPDANGEAEEVASAAADGDEPNGDDQLDALRQKTFRLRQFLVLLQKDLESANYNLERQRETMVSRSERMSDSHTLSVLLPMGRAETAVRLLFQLLLALLRPEEEADGSDVVQAATTLIGPSDGECFAKFFASVKSLEVDISEGRATSQDPGKVAMLTKQLEESWDAKADHKIRRACSNACQIKEWLVAAGEYLGASLVRNGKKAQATEIKQEFDTTLAVLQEELANGRIEAGAVSNGQIKAVQEMVHKVGGSAPPAIVRWALMHKAGNEAAASQLVVALPEARVAFESFKQPGEALLASSSQLSAVSMNQVRRVRTLLRMHEPVRRLADAIATQIDAEESSTDGSPCTDDKSTDVDSSAAAPALDDNNTASRAELSLLSWVLRVCEWVEANASCQPLHQQVMLAERKLADKVRSLDKTLSQGRRSMASSAHKVQLSTSLFPAEAPWKHFPWECSLLPRTEAEEALREAIELRDLSMLELQLPKAQAQALTKRNSRVYFEAVELRDMLTAEAQLLGSRASAPLNTADIENEIKIDMRSVSRQVSEEREPLSPCSGNMPPPIKREKTEDARERLGHALDVFVEPVSTAVPSGVPKQRPFVELLSEEASQFSSFVREEDKARRDMILATVSHSVGVSDIETEQCREQEQEKAQEQEQEQEIEMERYVDVRSRPPNLRPCVTMYDGNHHSTAPNVRCSSTRMLQVAYQRDNEEPQRWAFITLGETRHETQSGEALAAPFVEGSFYPASEFRLHGRSPLPFPEYLAVSRNHFNKEWVGERRIKNAVMVLEWVPDVTALAPSTCHAAAGTLSDAQDERLRSALELLDTRATRTFDRRALRQVIVAAEHTSLEDEALDALMGDNETLAFEDVVSLLTCGTLRPAESGRYFVLLSLAEAETIRCILHMRQGQPVVAGANVGLALRCIPAHDTIFDTSPNLPVARSYQAAISHNCFRFIDSALHFRPVRVWLT